MTAYEYDEAGRLVRESIEDSVKIYGYNRKNQVVMEKDADGNITRYYYDRLGNPTGYMNPNQELTDGKRTRFIYNKLDKLESVVTAEGNVHHYIYGIHNKVVRKVHPNAFSYDHMDAEGTSYDYDIFDRKIREHKVNGETKRFFYDANGNLIKLVMPEQYKEETDDGAGYLYEYDSCNRLVKETAPDGTVQKVLKYDLMGNVVKEIDANGYLTGNDDEQRAATVYSYDLLGHMTEKRVPVQCVETESEDVIIQYELTTYEYDDMGQLLVENRYFDLQTLESRSGKYHKISYQYDASNHLTGVSDSTGAKIVYYYDRKDQVVLTRQRIFEDAYKET